MIRLGDVKTFTPDHSERHENKAQGAQTLVIFRWLPEKDHENKAESAHD